MSGPLRLVLDTSVVVSGFRTTTGASARLIELIDTGLFVTIVSTSLFLEYEQVLKRPEQRVIHGLSLSQIDAVLRDLANHLTATPIYTRTRGELHDENDDHVLEAAVNGLADAIVTFNVRDFSPASERRGIRVVSPAAILPKGVLP